MGKYRFIVVIVLWLSNHSFLFAAQISMEFVFGNTGKEGAIVLDKLPSYTENEQFGFEFGSEHNVEISRSENKHLLSANLPFYFSVKVPEGNYRITIGYQGLTDSVYHSTVRSESRRLQIEQLRIPPGQFVERSFVVHLKSPRIGENVRVKLKGPREEGKLDWDDKLTLEFLQTNHIAYIRIQQVDNIRTLFLAGNSTVVNQEDEPWASWGQMIPRFFDEHVVVANHAESGLSLRSFLSSNRLLKILNLVKPGDYLFIEFGHNDQKEMGADAGAFNGYTKRLRFFVREFRAKGGIPVIVTSTARRAFGRDGQLLYTLGDYPGAARRVAKELRVPLIDLNKMTRMFYETLGVERSKKAFVHYPAGTFPDQHQPLEDNTHFNTYGAYQIAKMVLQGIKGCRLEIEEHVIDLQAYRADFPDSPDTWYWPSSIRTSLHQPEGN
ncbi:lysophospholipase L1-like esterase [Sphingobacterium allocomposti]|uniref:Lysophospholipase L1-like esterase n=1 Tax=Sphingobacterium allocomposti TaxID=415956 RepID=A0A5S5DR65_9SPHI|nr:rhamnogalacturonan acetylesterase [Sphingobacterium composti Yoo et al. 2007 non Ten et al. 2007]TYP98377.1 lysophospholipase L1-like esterase [Sphingobacterium composti Yoo et al. 2007 non Ten et al. 2007]